ncbi:helix-turn-helix domain-containing protein [Nocardia wallacei]|uniref:helix-turn-helix domain-containing protein n=1 Tax=Nocardia wallacei TaxID=480035 RepID=UPI0024581645|nr:helix-turn-helix transcriptional regulator [Nocardia wallacei]
MIDRDDDEGRRLGARLRDLRTAARCSGRQFAARLGWDPSRISRYETGRQVPTDSDIDQWCAAADARAEAPDLTALARRVAAARRDQQRHDFGRYRPTAYTLLLSLACVLGLGEATSAVPVSAQSATAVTAECPQRDDGPVYSGTGPGDRRSGPGVIFAFEHAYFQQRSAQAAREVVADGADVPSAEHIQRGIDHLPLGTTYCVQIDATPVAVDAAHQQWAVVLTQQLPGEPARTATQHITTARDTTGRTAITAIRQA